MATSFDTMEDFFLAGITDDMYMELTEEDTYEMLQDLLVNTLPRFEFPRFDLFDYELGAWSDMGTYCGVESNNVEVPATGWVGGTFNIELTSEEINIIALNMVIGWLGQQLDTTENTRMKFSGSDFKFTSQANHMAKLLTLKKDYEREGFHLQRLYKRRLKDEDGIMRSTFGSIMKDSPLGRKESGL